ncbi:MAG: GAF domain-containing protein [Thermoflexales bacterium]|nr:GAF domain-containing protein [Thermoflexales bacterium]
MGAIAVRVRLVSGLDFTKGDDHMFAVEGKQMIRALILDDDPLFTDQMAKRLRYELPIQVATAQRPEEAVRIAEEEAQPFDVFLIDERLGPGKDGIAAMEDLMRLQPNAEAIIFTGFDDPEVGYRALQAGAWCYLPKGDVLIPELTWRLRQLNGLRALDEAMRRADRAESLREAAEVIVRSGLQMGFERARLWWVDAAAGTSARDGMPQILIGLAAAGDCASAEMQQHHIPVAQSPYAARALTSPAEIMRFRGEELGPDCLTCQESAQGRCAPVGEWLLAPLQAEGHSVGLLALDNVIRPREIVPEQLRLLRKFCREASTVLARAWRYERQTRLNALTCDILAHADRPSLKDTLAEICQVTREVVGVDCASIVPATADGTRVTYDIEQAGHAGWQKVPDPIRMPRPDGLTAKALREGMLAVPDTDEPGSPDLRRLIETHPVLSEEGVRALICAPVRSVETGETLGALRLYWRSPQMFGHPELTQAKMFTRLAAVAIQNWRAAQRTRDAAAAEREARARELASHQRVMDAALQPDACLEDVVRALLDAAREIINLPQAVVEVNLRDWERADEPVDPEPREIRREYFLDAGGALRCNREADPFRGITGLALRTGQTQRAADVTASEWQAHFYDVHGRGTRSQLVAPIRRGDEPNPAAILGALNVESPFPNAFNEAHARALEDLADVAALALDNARCLADRRRVLEVARRIAAPINLADTLDEIKRVMREVARDLSALTLWHLVWGTKDLILGTHFGVRDLDALYAERATAGGVVQRGFDLEAPRFIEHTGRDDFSKDFVRREGIRSVAILPLRAGGETVGVMFLNYRHPHVFTAEERFLFKVLADLAAGSIRDSILLEFAEKQRDQRDLALQVTELAATTFSKDEALRRIMVLLKKHYPHAKVAIYTYAPAESALKVAPASLDFYPFDDVSETGTLPVGDRSIAGHVARLALETRELEVYNCPDASADPYFLPGCAGMRPELCASLMSSSGDLLGVLILESPNLQAFNEDDEEQMRGIARQIGLVMERDELTDRLRYQTALAVATGGFVDFAHGAGREFLSIRRRVRWLLHDSIGLSEQGRRWVTEIGEGVARLWLAFKKALGSDNEKQPEYRDVPCDTLVREFVQEAWRQRPTAALALDPVLNCGDVRVRVNPKGLRWALGHLVGNAVAAMSNGKQGSRLTVNTRLRAGRWVEVRVEDDGPGVLPELRLRLFREKIDNSLGHGIGLLRVRQYIEAMGGIVRLADEQPPQGAAFIILLPVAPPHVGAR